MHLNIKTFYGTTKNAIYTQIWIAVSTIYCSLLRKSDMVWFQVFIISITRLDRSSSIGADIRELYNQPTVPAIVPEADSVEHLTLW